MLVPAAPRCHCHRPRDTSLGPLRRAATTPVPAPARMQQAGAWRGPLQAPATPPPPRRRDPPTCLSQSGQQQQQQRGQQRRQGRAAWRRGPGGAHGQSAPVTSRGTRSPPGLLSKRGTPRAMEPASPAGWPRARAALWVPAHRLQGVTEVSADKGSALHSIAYRSLEMSDFTPEEDAGRVEETRFSQPTVGLAAFPRSGFCPRHPST